ncbi:unnamed protein product [Rotaria socialis]
MADQLSLEQAIVREGDERGDISRLTSTTMPFSSYWLTSRLIPLIVAFNEQISKNHEIEDYARAGNRVKETVTVDEGLLDGLQHTMEPLLRFSGDVLTPEQAKLLKLFQRPLAQFKIKVKLHWNKNNEKV